MPSSSTVAYHVPGPTCLQELHKALAHEVWITHCRCAQRQVEGCLMIWPLLHDARKAVGGLLEAPRPDQGQPNVAHGVEAQAMEGGGRLIQRHAELLDGLCIVLLLEVDGAEVEPQPAGLQG